MRSKLALFVGVLLLSGLFMAAGNVLLGAGQGVGVVLLVVGIIVLLVGLVATAIIRK